MTFLPPGGPNQGELVEDAVYPPAWTGGIIPDWAPQPGPPAWSGVTPWVPGQKSQAAAPATCVTHLGSTWVCIQDNVGIEPSLAAPNYWRQVASAGGFTGSIFTTTVPLTTWPIVHNLGLYPHVLLLDNNGNQIKAAISYPSLMAVTINFNAPFTGKAILTGSTVRLWAPPVPQAVWTIPHNLPVLPEVTVLDPVGNVVVAEVSYPDSGTVVVTFNAPFMGQALLN